MNQENYWYHNVEADAVEDDVDGESREDLLLALKEMKSGRHRSFRCICGVNCC